MINSRPLRIVSLDTPGDAAWWHIRFLKQRPLRAGRGPDRRPGAHPALIENLTLGTAAVSYRTESMHGAGSPEAQVIMIGRLSDLEGKKALARRLAGVKGQESSRQA